MAAAPITPVIFCFSANAAMLTHKESHETYSSEEAVHSYCRGGHDPLQFVGFRAVFRSERDFELICREHPSEGGQGSSDLAPTCAAEVFQAILSASGEAIGQIASPGVRASFQQALPLEPSEIAVERTTVGNRRNQIANVIRS